jgi:aspartyl-tRNA(Asn)/glutamyl-tRNA(Gln) amidotransferase subunit A
MTEGAAPLPGLHEAAAALRSGELSATELTRAALARIAATEPWLHAFVAVTAEAALAEAAAADAELRAGRDRGPLHGLPVAIKDIIDVEGVATRAGSLALAAAPPAAADAPVVARLRAAGAVIVGKTVTQEFAAGTISPPARNPWDPSRIPGGSSGGSAAAVAAGCVVAALGTDTGGSIRCPAAVTGITGLKPTFGAVDRGGIVPLAWSLDTVGPLARTVAGASAVMTAIADRPLAAEAGAAEPSPLGDTAAEADLTGVRFGVPRPHFFDRLQLGVATAVGTAIDLLRELGAEVVEAPWAEAGAARDVAFVLNRVETAAVHERLRREEPERFALLNPDLRARVAAGPRLPATAYVRALRARSAVRESMARLFAEHRCDASVVPGLPATAAAADDLFVDYGDDLGREVVNAAYTRLTMPFNSTGQPVLALPCGFDEVGLPVGIQLVGRPGAELALCRIGEAFERAAGWHLRQPPLEGLRGDALAGEIVSGD